MMDDLVSASLLVFGFIVAAVQAITIEDIKVAAIVFLFCAAVIETYLVLKGRAQRGVRRYAARFRNHGLRNRALWYSMSMSAVLLGAAALLVFVKDLNQLMMWTLALVASLSLVVFTVLGWRERGDSWFNEPKPPLRRFAIFYEPATTAVVPFVLHKLTDIIPRLLPAL